MLDYPFDFQGFVQQHEEDINNQSEQFYQNYHNNAQRRFQPSNLNKKLLKYNNFLKQSHQSLRNYLKGTTINNVKSQKNQNKANSIQNDQYPNILILRMDEYVNNQGLNVYRGFRARTSDKYFHSLQKVDLLSPITKQSHIGGLIFNSKFQCGNLDSVFKRPDCTYDLYLRADTNTKGHMQWYYFSVKNKKKLKVCFNIYFFNKIFSLYQRGMKPYVFSKKQYQLNGTQWIQSGSNIKYELYTTNQDNNSNKRKRFFLSFQYQFNHEYDEVYFAACPPYSYNYLIEQIQKHKLIQSGDFSVAGLNVPLIKISSLDRTNTPKGFFILIARSHPGQSSSSWVMEGIMSYFSKHQIGNQQNDNNKLDSFLKDVTIYLIPMMNSDGVYLGNYRTGVLGVDFNRSFNNNINNFKQKFFPEIAAVKELVRSLKRQGKVLGFIDIHGHSMLRNTFIYGGDRSELQNSIMNQLPESLNQKSKYFKLKSCKFVNGDKPKTEIARVFFQIKERIPSLTIQNSLGLYTVNKQIFPFLTEDWIKFGKQIIDSICDLYNIKIKEQLNNKKRIIKYYTDIDDPKSSPQKIMPINKGQQYCKKQVYKQKNTNIGRSNKSLQDRSQSSEQSEQILLLKTKQRWSRAQKNHTSKNPQKVDIIVDYIQNLSQNYDIQIYDQDSDSENLPEKLQQQVFNAAESVLSNMKSKNSKSYLNRFRVHSHLEKNYVLQKKEAKKELRGISTKIKEISLVLNDHTQKSSASNLVSGTMSNLGKGKRIYHVKSHSTNERSILQYKQASYVNYSRQSNMQGPIFGGKKILQNMKLNNFKSNNIKRRTTKYYEN